MKSKNKYFYHDNKKRAETKNNWKKNREKKLIYSVTKTKLMINEWYNVNFDLILTVYTVVLIAFTSKNSWSQKK